MTDIRALKKRLAQLRKKKALALKELQPKRKRGRPPGSKNGSSKRNKDSAAQPRRRAKFSIEMRPCYKIPQGLSRVIRKTDTGYVRQWAVSNGTDLIGYFTYYEDAIKAIKENK